MTIIQSPETIVTFWRDAGYDKWYAADPAFDAEIRERFLQTHEAAAAGELAAWEETPQGVLALLILLDQFPRNMFRGTSRMFATDPLARRVADTAIARGFDAEVDAEMRSFFYLPFMHSETLSDQERCVSHYSAINDEKSLPYAHEHRDIITRFGRFPHRNVTLGRDTTAEEKDYLEGGGFAG